LTYVAVIAFAVAAVAFLVAPGDGTAAGRTRTKVDLARLELAATDTRIGKAPRDPDPQGTTDGEVVRPRRMLPLFAAPGRRPVGKIGTTLMGPTWLPVVDRKGGWSRVLLPSRPNGSTAWLRTSQVERRTSPYLVRVHVGSKTLELLHEGEVVGTWDVAVGKPETPTPTGRTFLMGSITDAQQSYSPVILPLGTHSETLDTYGGGPGTVAIHTWPDETVFGTAASHGCIRVPAEALDHMTRVPLGTLVLIDER
jgi:hypothetical protein